MTSNAYGSPVAGATVQINGRDASYTLKTNQNGQYTLWLETRNNPLQMIVTQTGYQRQERTVKIAKGTTTTESFVLKKE